MRSEVTNSLLLLLAQSRSGPTSAAPRLRGPQSGSWQPWTSLLLPGVASRGLELERPDVGVIAAHGLRHPRIVNCPRKAALIRGGVARETRIDGGARRAQCERLGGPAVGIERLKQGLST